MAGGKYICRSVTDLLATQLQQGDANQPPHARLSDREFQVLGLIAHGNTVMPIAEDLSLSVKSVSTYRARIVEKLHLKSTADLIRCTRTLFDRITHYLSFFLPILSFPDPPQTRREYPTPRPLNIWHRN
jgi:DNA-binding CsgD family transcriptional regulator